MSLMSFASVSCGHCPRVAFYVFMSLIEGATMTPVFTGRSDLATLEISDTSLFS